MTFKRQNVFVRQTRILSHQWRSYPKCAKSN